jgi:hypothetical protein
MEWKTQEMEVQKGKFDSKKYIRENFIKTTNWINRKLDVLIVEGKFPQEK